MGKKSGKGRRGRMRGIEGAGKGGIGGRGWAKERNGGEGGPFSSLPKFKSSWSGG